MNIIAYACSNRPNSLWSAAQFDSALPKNRSECDIPLVTKADATEILLTLKELLEAYSKPDERLCCDGRDCGCRGSTVHQQVEHYARAAIAKAEGV